MRLQLIILTVLAMSSGALAADTYKLDPDHCHVLFKAVHLGLSNSYGRFTKMSGEFKFDEKDPSKSSVEMVIDADSLATDVEKRDKHLKSPDFLDTKQFPKITFKSDSVKKLGDKGYEIAGKLTLHGVTKPLTITWNKIGAGNDPWGNTRLGGEARFTIKRSAYDIRFMLPGVSDDIEMTVATEGIKAK